MSSRLVEQSTTHRTTRLDVQQELDLLSKHDAISFAWFGSATLGAPSSMPSEPGKNHALYTNRTTTHGINALRLCHAHWLNRGAYEQTNSSSRSARSKCGHDLITSWAIFGTILEQRKKEERGIFLVSISTRCKNTTGMISTWTTTTSSACSRRDTITTRRMPRC